MNQPSLSPTPVPSVPANSPSLPDASNPAALIGATRAALDELAVIMNEETTLLRSGQYEQAASLSARKATTGQEYVQLARTIQNNTDKLSRSAPDLLRQLQGKHEKLATQIAQNLKVLATARNVTRSILGDVADAVAKTSQPDTYAPNGTMTRAPANGQASGISLNRSL